MRICIPTAGNNGLEEQVFNHFGSARFFMIYDTETKESNTISNDNEHHSHNACQPLSKIGDQDVDVILTSGMGRRAVTLLNESGIKVYLLEGETAKEAIEKFEAGTLKEIDAANACAGHGCH